MKTIQKITVLAVLLGASPLVTAQTTETLPTPMERANDPYTTNDDDSGKWGLVGLAGLLGLLALRRHREDRHQDHRLGRGIDTH